MSLKFRYAGFLLFILILILGFCCISLYWVYRGNYVLTAIIFVILYLCTYLLGRQFARIFFLLSILRLLRKNNGTLTLQEFDLFFDKTLANRRNPTARRQVKEEVLNSLLREKAIAICENTLVLL